MAIPIQLRRNGTAASTPSSLLHGEVALNYADGKIFWKDASNVIQSFTFQAYALSSHTHAASDITSGTLDAARIANDSITYAKLQNVSATDRLLGRSSAGAGDVEEVTCTAFGRSLIDDADAAAARSTLSVQPTASPTFTGTLTAAQARVNGSDSSTVLLVNGGTKGVRFNISSASSAIEGVDNGGVSSYQPLVVGGSTLTLATAGASAITIDGSQKATLANQLLVTAGSASACGVAFSGDTNTGLAQIGGADTASLVTGGVERVRVGSGGGVGIGTTTTTDALNVVGITSHYQSSNGTPALGSKTYYSACFENFSAGYGLALGGVQGGNGAAYLQVQSFSSAVAYPMYLQALGGEVLIGTTTDNGAYLLQVNSQIYATNATIATSDARFKTNVESLNDATAVIEALRPVAFDFIPHAERNFAAERQVGLIAQEAQAALAGIDYADSVVAQCGDHLGLAYEKLVPVLIKALQESNARIAALEERLNHA